MPQTGIVRKLPLAEYLAMPAVSKHALDEFERSPLHCKRYLDGGVSEQTDAMLFGQLLHSLILENKEDFIVQPQFYANGQKAWHNGATYCKEWNAAKTKPIISAAEQRELSFCRQAVVTSNLAMSILKVGEPEVSLFAKCPRTGLHLKCRLDWLRPKGVVDLKSTTDASTRAFSREIVNRRYHVQAAMNQYLCELNDIDAPNWHLIILEKGEQPMVNVRLLKSDAVAVGRMEMFRALEGIAECMESGVWNGYCDESEPIGEIDIPAWAANQAMGAGVELTIGGQKITV